MADPIALLVDTSFDVLGLPRILFGIPLDQFEYIAIISTIVAMGLGGFVYFAGWSERKMIARIHSRYGPTYVGPRGLLQLLADLIKLIAKEDIIPDKAHKKVFAWIPIALATAAFMMAVFVPFGPGIVILDTPYSLLGVFAIFSTVPTMVLLAGWASNSKYSMIGGLRSAAQTLAYEIPLLLSVIGVVLLSGSLSLTGIVESQNSLGLWFIILQPLGFIVFLISSVAALERLPMDITEAENELVAGWRTEYSGIRFLLLLQGEYFLMLFMSMVTVILFLGGWNGPILPGFIWFWGKVGAVIFFMFLLRGSWPRPRIDQLLDLGWKWLIPLGVINLAITPIIKIVFLGG